MRTVLGIAIAGALGALARYGLEGLVSRRLAGAVERVHIIAYRGRNKE